MSGESGGYLRTKLLASALIGVCVIAAIVFYFLRPKPQEPLTAQRVAFLVEEMTKTPASQQKALDELVLTNENQLILLMLPYLDDRRALATTNVKFINTSPKAFESHFLILASSVEERTLRYLCWHTASCDASFENDDQAYKAAQLRKLADACRLRYPKNAQECRVIDDHKG